MRNLLILLSFALAPAPAAARWTAPVTTAPATALEEAIIAQALTCNRMRKKADPAYLLDLLRVEEKFDEMPHTLRGMVLAAACAESGFDQDAKGDRAFDKQGRAKAIGVLQQWPWFEGAYQVDRTDPLAAAEAWLKHIQTHLAKTQKRCGRHLKGETLWVRAWAHAISAPRKGGRCLETPKHYQRLQRWRKTWYAELGRPGMPAPSPPPPVPALEAGR